MRFLVSALVLIILGTSQLPAAVALKLSSFNPEQPFLAQPHAGVWEWTRGGPALAEPDGAIPEGEVWLEFEYFSIGGGKSFHILKGPEFVSKKAIRLPTPSHREAWTPYAEKLGQLPKDTTALRFDLAMDSGKTLQMRKVRLRVGPPAPSSVSTEGHSASPAALAAEFTRPYAALIESVEIGESTVRISGNCAKVPAPVLVAELPMDRLLDSMDPFEVKLPIDPDEAGHFSLEIPRKRTRSGKPYDRLMSRWRLVREDEQGVEVVSRARYPEKVHCAGPPPEAAPLSSKKGLGGWRVGVIPGELENLGIAAVTVNVVVDTLLATGPGADAIPYEWQGRTYYARKAVVDRFDKTFIKAQEKGCMVSVILLVTNPARGPRPGSSRIAHPAAAKEGTFAMPDVVSEEGIAAYGGMINFMADRWSRVDTDHGRIHHWIVHNEVDAGWVWTNAGKLEAVPYMDLYQRSMRLTDLIVRQYDPNARAFITLTHHWAKAGRPEFYGSRQMLELLARFEALEGPFPWALAYHPYPQSLRNPNTWNDQQADFNFDASKITPRNLEVLDAWMKRPEMRYRGDVRDVHLSENGFNSPDYSEESLERQAAGMAYAWKKIQPLDSIKVWHYHNWIDNPHEGGLRIGLRRLPGDKAAPRGPKPIWHLYRDLSTDGEESACTPYLRTIGISGWNEILHKEEIR